MIIIFDDNQDVIVFVKNSQHHKRVKYINIQHH